LCDGRAGSWLWPVFIFETLQKKKAIIEDVVVDKDHAEKVWAKSLMAVLIAVARKRKIDCVDLTSQPYRKIAHAMYESMGFKKRETNCYRLKL